MRGSNCKTLTTKVLVFWIGDRSREVVTYERCSHMEARLYNKLVIYYGKIGNVNSEQVRKGVLLHMLCPIMGESPKRLRIPNEI